MPLLEGLPAAPGSSASKQPLALRMVDQGDGTGKPSLDGASSGLALETGGNLATVATKLSPVAAAAGIVKTAQDATTATTLASNTCVRGFWLYNLPDSAGVLYYAAAAATAPTSAGANAIGFVVPGDRKWFGLSNTNAIKIIASATTTNYAVDLE